MPLPAYDTEFLMTFVGDVDMKLPSAKFVTTQPHAPFRAWHVSHI